MSLIINGLYNLASLSKIRLILRSTNVTQWLPVLKLWGRIGTSFCARLFIIYTLSINGLPVPWDVGLEKSNFLIKESTIPIFFSSFSSFSLLECSLISAVRTTLLISSIVFVMKCDRSLMKYSRRQPNSLYLLRHFSLYINTVPTIALIYAHW